MDKQSGVSVHNRYHAFSLFSAHPFIACNPRSSQSGILDLGSKSQDCCPDFPHASALLKTGTTFKNVGALTRLEKLAIERSGSLQGSFFGKNLS